MPSKALQSNNEYHQSYGFKGPFLVEPPSELDHATFFSNHAHVSCMGTKVVIVRETCLLTIWTDC